MISSLTKEQSELTDCMSRISEKCYSAGWMKNLEYVLWNAVCSGPIKYGHDFITSSDIEELLRLSNNCNSWIIFDEMLEEIALSLTDWEKKFSYQKSINPNILKG